MRQAGILAAAGLYALEHHIERMAEDHQNAGLLAEAIASLPGIHIDLDTVQTNIIVIDIAGSSYRDSDSVSDAVSALKAQGVLVIPFGETKMRAVTHLDVSREDILQAIQAFEAVFGAARVQSS